jgi:Fe-S-cluster containining protein
MSDASSVAWASRPSAVPEKGSGGTPKPRKIRVAILGDSPCDLCTAACCKQNGHEYAALLQGDEPRKFAPFAISIPFNDGERIVVETVLPYVNGRCQFLGDDDRCTIYDDRPRVCRTFQCITKFNANGVGQHETFLQRNPCVLEMLEAL